MSTPTPNPKREQTRHQPAHRVPREPDPDPRRHLIARIPRRCQEHEARRNRRLGDPEQEAHHHQTLKAATRGGAAYDGSPEERVGGEVRACWEAGDEDGGWVRPGEVADVEDAADPAVLLAVEVLLSVLVRVWRG